MKVGPLFFEYGFPQSNMLQGFVSKNMYPCSNPTKSRAPVFLETEENTKWTYVSRGNDAKTYIFCSQEPTFKGSFQKFETVFEAEKQITLVRFRFLRF